MADKEVAMDDEPVLEAELSPRDDANAHGGTANEEKPGQPHFHSMKSMCSALEIKPMEREGHPGSLNEQQSQALEELKKRVANSKYASKVKQGVQGEIYLCRMLRATMKGKSSKKLFQVEDAMGRFVEIQELKEKYKVDHFLDSGTTPDKWDEFEAIRPEIRWCDEKANALVTLEAMGSTLSYIKTDTFDMETWKTCTAYAGGRNERDTETMMEKSGTEPRGVIALIEEEGVSMGILRRTSFIKAINTIGSTMYPEQLDRVIIVNAPWLFAKLFEVLKRFLDPDTVSKIHVFPDIPKQKLRELLDPRFLPKKYGGDRDVELPFSSHYRSKQHGPSS